MKKQTDSSLEFVKFYGNVEQARGQRLKTKGLIVDEGVDPLIIKELSTNHEFLGGFSRL